ncbi:MAG TPA: hypothetical protein VHT96_10910 [Clostridia bacterium]|nr:hypothetical protein [Clostridia bacterium]
MSFKKLLTVILVFIMVMGAAGQPVFAKDLEIRDMSTSDPAYYNVQWVVNQGYMSLTLGRFYAGKFVKRSEFAAIVTKLTGSGLNLQNPKTPTFKDITKQDQFYKQIETSKSYFVTYKSSAGKLFKPNSYLTREDAMMAVVKILGYDSNEAVGSNDNTDMLIEDIIGDAGNINPALLKYVAIGISNELMDLRYYGDETFFDPKGNITRRDLALLIYNAYQKKDYNAEESEESDPNQGNGDQNTGDTDENGNGDSSDENNQVLSKVGLPSWNFTSVNWSEVSNAANYEIKLYKNDNAIAVETVAGGITFFDFRNIISSDLSTAVYKVTVQAKGAGSYKDGPASEAAAKTFSLQDYRIPDGQGISVKTNTSTGTHTISFDAAKLPARMPTAFNVSLHLNDIVDDENIPFMVNYSKEKNAKTFRYSGRTGDYYTMSDDDRDHILLLLFDDDMNFLGYYDYLNPLS